MDGMNPQPLAARGALPSQGRAGHTAGLGPGGRAPPEPQHKATCASLAPVPCPGDSDALSCWHLPPGQTLAWDRLSPWGEGTQAAWC